MVFILFDVNAMYMVW